MDTEDGDRFEIFLENMVVSKILGSNHIDSVATCAQRCAVDMNAHQYADKVMHVGEYDPLRGRSHVILFNGTKGSKCRVAVSCHPRCQVQSPEQPLLL